MNNQGVNNVSTACFFPCCSKKIASGQIIEPKPITLEAGLPSKWSMLKNGRQKLQEMITYKDIVSFDYSSPITSALYLYRGALFQQLNLSYLINEIKSNKLRIFILSAGYGIVDAFEPLLYYDAEMKGKIAKHWRTFDLQGIICELLLTFKPRHVFGFFAGTESWSDPGAKYRFFFVEGLNNAIQEGLEVDLSGCFYRSSGRGTKPILQSLGNTFMHLAYCEFNQSVLSDFAKTYRKYGSTTISFKE